MQQLRRNHVSRVVSYVLIAALLATQGLICLPAQAQVGQNVPAVTVVPFQDETGQAGPANMREATAAAALSLEDSREYVVTSTTDLDRELQALRMQPPLSTPEQIRLGQRLHADKVLVGRLAALQVDSKSGRARVELHLMLLDVGIGEYLDGAISSIETKAIPGFNGDVTSVVHEALRQAADAAVTSMLSTTVRRGSVDLVDDLGNININLGSDDGIGVGSDLLVMRPVWQPDVEQVILRRVGVIRVADLESNLSVARVVEGSVPSTGDRVFRIYKPISAQKVEARGRSIKKGLELVAAVGLLFGLFAVATGGTTASPSRLSCALAQDGNGSVPDILLTIDTSQIAEQKTHGWLIYRSNGSSVSAIPGNLIDVFRGSGDLPFYDDDPAVRNAQTSPSNMTFTFVKGDGEVTATLTATYNHPALVAGSKYYYRVQRFMEPLQNPGANAPIAALQIVPPNPNPTLTVTPPEALSDASAPCGQVTYFLPPRQLIPGDYPAIDAQSRPTDLADPSSNFDWAPTTGANDYIVQLFPATDPDGLGSPIRQSEVVRSTSAANLTKNLSGGSLDGDTYYFWRVGARLSTDPTFPIFKPTGVSAWLYSTMRKFKTVYMPPAQVGGVTPRVPTGHAGPWGSSRGHR